MKVVAFVNNIVGLRSLETIEKHGDTICALIVHPRESSRYLDEILASTDQTPATIDASTLRNPETIEQLAALNPDIGVSAFFGYILRPEIINTFPRGIINLHPAYLPYNRGSYPNVWAIAEDTPAGATIHYIDEGVDTGDIIDQIKIEIAPEDTGESLYEKLETTCIELFTQTWPKIAKASGKIVATKQQNSEGTTHRVKDTEQLDRINLDNQYTTGELLNIIRARTFTGHTGTYFEQNGTKYFLKIEIEKE